MGSQEDCSLATKTSPRLLSVIDEDINNESLKSNQQRISENVSYPAVKTQRKRKTSVAIAPTETDLKQLKETATKLKLNTRRPSYLVWREQYIEKPKVKKSCDQFDVAKSTKCEKMTNDRQVRINDSLDWIRLQLSEMRRMDQNLARQFLGIRREITRLKLQKSCEAHEDMLDDAAIGMEEFQELSKVFDEPHGSYTPSPLKHLGLTKMNLSSRRFSTC